MVAATAIASASATDVVVAVLSNSKSRKSQIVYSHTDANTHSYKQPGYIKGTKKSGDWCVCVCVCTTLCGLSHSKTSPNRKSPQLFFVGVHCSFSLSLLFHHLLNWFILQLVNFSEEKINGQIQQMDVSACISAACCPNSFNLP